MNRQLVVLLAFLITCGAGTLMIIPPTQEALARDAVLQRAAVESEGKDNAWLAQAYPEKLVRFRNQRVDLTLDDVTQPVDTIEQRFARDIQAIMAEERLGLVALTFSPPQPLPADMDSATKAVATTVAHAVTSQATPASAGASPSPTAPLPEEIEADITVVGSYSSVLDTLARFSRMHELAAVSGAVVGRASHSDASSDPQIQVKIIADLLHMEGTL